MPILYFVKLDPAAVTPSKATKMSAGFDLCSLYNEVVAPGGRPFTVSTGLAFAFPENSYGRLAARSSLAVNPGIIVGAGVIDPDYRGEVKIVIYNMSDKVYEIKAGDKIAQMVVEKAFFPKLRQIPKFIDDDDDDSSCSRGAKGFGSSGKA